MDGLRAQALTYKAGQQAVDRLARLDKALPKARGQLTYAEYMARAGEYAQRNPIFAMQLAEAEKQRQAMRGGW